MPRRGEFVLGNLEPSNAETRLIKRLRPGDGPVDVFDMNTFGV